MENNLIKLHFSYTDELNQESTLNKTLSSDAVYYSSSFEVLLEQFKQFMKASGFDEEMVNRIQLIEEDEEDDEFEEMEDEDDEENEETFEE